MKTLLFTLAISLLTWSGPSSAVSIRLPGETSQQHKLPDQLILAALQRSKHYEPVYPYGNIDSLPLSTRINDVRNGQLDLFFALSKPDYEQEFLAIPFPIYRGLLGWRLAVVKQENKDILRNVKNLDDLQRFSAGQGALWADTAILEANGLPVIKEHKYTNLFRMLEADRFDYFPRGINEPWLEIQRESDLNLAVDEHVLLQYKVPFYFYVRKQNHELADHLHQLLEEMLQDGSFLKLFYDNKEIQMVFDNANLKKRRVIALQNPYLAPGTPIHREELWMDINEFKTPQPIEVLQQ